VEIIIESHVRFKGEAGEQATMFFLDPSGNALESPHVANPCTELQSHPGNPADSAWPFPGHLSADVVQQAYRPAAIAAIYRHYRMQPLGCVPHGRHGRHGRHVPRRSRRSDPMPTREAQQGSGSSPLYSGVSGVLA